MLSVPKIIPSNRQRLGEANGGGEEGFLMRWKRAIFGDFVPPIKNRTGTHQKLSFSAAGRENTSRAEAGVEIGCKKAAMQSGCAEIGMLSSRHKNGRANTSMRGELSGGRNFGG